MEGVRRPARRERSPARTSRPPSASRSNGAARRPWRCGRADPSFCSTISSPGATVRSVSEKSTATIVPDSPARRPCRRRWSRSGRRWASPVVVVPSELVSCESSSTRTRQPRGGAPRRSVARSGRRGAIGRESSWPGIRTPPARWFTGARPPAARRTVTVSMRHEVDDRVAAPGRAPRPRSDREPARADGRPRGAWRRRGSWPRPRG